MQAEYRQLQMKGITTDYCTSIFKKDEEEDVEDIIPTEMEASFTKEKIQKAVKKISRVEKMLE